jgi:hypothetical protein
VLVVLFLHFTNGCFDAPAGASEGVIYRHERGGLANRFLASKPTCLPCPHLCTDHGHRHAEPLLQQPQRVHWCGGARCMPRYVAQPRCPPSAALPGPARQPATPSATRCGIAAALPPCPSCAAMLPLRPLCRRGEDAARRGGQGVPPALLATQHACYSRPTTLPLCGASVLACRSCLPPPPQSCPLLHRSPLRTALYRR